MAVNKLMDDAQKIAEHFGYSSPKLIDPARVFWILDVPTQRNSRAKLRFIKQHDSTSRAYLEISVRYCEDNTNPDSLIVESAEQAISRLKELLS